MKKLIGMLAVAGTILVGTANAQSLRRYDIRVINNSSQTVTAVYARNLATDRLYGDLLGDGVIGPGEIHTFRLDDSTGNCYWRLQAETASGQTVRREMNVCATGSWTLND